MGEAHRDEDISWGVTAPVATAPTTSAPTPTASPDDDIIWGATTRKAGVNPDTGKPFTRAEVQRLMFGPDTSMGMNPLELFLAGAGADVSNRMRGAQGETLSPEEKAIQEKLMANWAARAGSVVPSAAATMLAPQSVPAQMAIGAASGATEPAENWWERGTNALKGAVAGGIGQMAATGIVKGGNAMRGDLTRAGEAANFAKSKGLNLTAGDIADSDILRAAERASFASPSKLQGEQVGNWMSTGGTDMVTTAVKDAHRRAMDNVSAAAQNLDSIIAANNLPGVSPRQTYAAIRDLYLHNPASINSIDDDVLRQRIINIANYPSSRIPRNMSFEDMNALRKAIGPVEHKIRGMSQSPNTNVTPPTANRWSKLYSSISNDIDAWGSRSGLTQDVLDAHNAVKNTFKNEVVPIRENRMGAKLVYDKYDSPEAIIRDLASPQYKSLIRDLYPHLDDEGKKTFDALMAASRGTRAFRTGEDTWSRPLAMSAALSTPLWLMPAISHGGILPGLAAAGLAEQAAVHAVNSPVGKMLLKGSSQVSPNELANRAAYATIRGGTQYGTLEELRRRRQEEAAPNPPALR